MRSRLILALPFTLSLTCATAQSAPGTDERIQASIQRDLRAYSLTQVRSSVQDGDVTLTGSVNVCRDRMLAREMARAVNGVLNVEDDIEVAGPAIPDQQLEALINHIVADRLRRLGGFGYGSVTARVQNGVVTLSGTAAPELTAPTIASITNTQGVRNLIDRIHRVRPYDPTWRKTHPPDLSIQ
jgi:osmotically-inducible protein OsmY